MPTRSGSCSSMKQAGPFTESLSTPLFTGTYVPGYGDQHLLRQERLVLDDPRDHRAGPQGCRQRLRAFPELLRHRRVASRALRSRSTRTRRRTSAAPSSPDPPSNPGGVQRIDVTMMIDPNLSRAAMKQSAILHVRRHAQPGHQQGQGRRLRDAVAGRVGAGARCPGQWRSPATSTQARPEAVGLAAEQRRCGRDSGCPPRQRRTLPPRRTSPAAHRARRVIRLLRGAVASRG